MGTWLAAALVAALGLEAAAQPTLEAALPAAQALLGAFPAAKPQTPPEAAGTEAPRPEPEAPPYQPELWNDGDSEALARFYADHQEELGKVSSLEGRLFPWALAQVFYLRTDEEFVSRYGLSLENARDFRRAFDEATRGVQYRTNCYAYAVDSPRGHPPGWKASPGHKGGLGIAGKEHFTADGQELLRRAQADGLLPAGTQPARRPGYYLVALFVIPGDDYHFIRQDRDGTWSGKAGEEEATNLDFADRIITDPRTADFWEYRFVTFLYVPKGGLDVTPPPAAGAPPGSVPAAIQR